MSEAVVLTLVVLTLLAAERLGRRRTDAALFVLALSAGIVHTDFLDFHGGGTFVHYHDAGHYYLGARYFPELGYDGLYGALLVAEVESEGRMEAILARDSTSGRLRRAEVVLAHGTRVRDRFSDERWQSFRSDAAVFREALGPLFVNFLTDHGFNPTPIWALGAGFIAELLPPVDTGGLLLLALLDSLLVGVTAVAIYLAFGRRAALLAMIFLLTAFGGGNFDWIGGAYLRYAWLSFLVLGVAATGRGKHATAGALVAIAAGLRIFPAIFALAAVAQIAWSLWRRRRPDRDSLRFASGFAVMAVMLFALTMAWPGYGWAAWTSFVENMTRYLAQLPYNVMGFGPVAQSLALLLPPTVSAMAATILSRSVGLLCLALAMVLGLRKDPVGAIALGCLALYGLLEMAIYYSLVLVLLVLAHRHEARALSWIFAIEAIAWTAAAFLESPVHDHVAHSLLLLLLFSGLYIDDVLDLLGIARTDGRDAPEPQTLGSAEK